MRGFFTYFHLIYTNGPTPHATFRLTTIFHRESATDLTRTAIQTIGPAEPVKVTRSLIEPSILGADRDLFGAAIFHERIAQISVDFSNPIANNDVTSTVTGTGATAQANGQATLSTG